MNPIITSETENRSRYLVKAEIISVHPPSPKTGFSNPQCLLRLYNNCCPKMSREHVVPEGILRKFEGVEISGFPWAKELKVIPPNALASKIFCKRHNENLGRLDAEGIRFFTAIFEAQRDCGEDVTRFVGENIERWLWKIHLGSIASRTYSFGDLQVPRLQVPIGSTDMLFDHKRWRERQSLFFDHQMASHVRYGVSVNGLFFLGQVDKPCGIQIDLCGMRFCVTIPQATPKGFLERPSQIIFRRGARRRIVQIDWIYHACKGYIIEFDLTNAKNVADNKSE